FSINPFSEFFIFLFTIGAILISILYFEFSQKYNELSLFLSFSVLGMYAVSMSNSIPGIFIGLELISIPTVFSILLSKKSLEAATKLFIMAAVSIAIFSFAMAISYGGVNTISIIETQYSLIMLIAFVLFIVGLGFEASIFPFNVLIPDVYEGSPTYVTALMGSLNKKAGFVALIQIVILMFVTFHSAFDIIAILSVFTMFYGNIGALVQKNLKRLMAYSSISQAGYILIGIATATVYGISGSLFQIFAHMFIFIGIMTILLILELKNKKTIDDIVGLYRESPFMAIALAIFMLSLVGLPLTTGFVGKLIIFISAISAGLAILTFLGIINSIISLYYYLKVLLSVYSEGKRKTRILVNNTALIIIVICLAITIIFGIYPQPIIKFINSASSYLFSIS
ncbi:MAG: NADH-quinone oxidoreductase subunit N, partial [Candidatus Micrarchaeaceae archaeon]